MSPRKKSKPNPLVESDHQQEGNEQILQHKHLLPSQPKLEPSEASTKPQDPRPVENLPNEISHPKPSAHEYRQNTRSSWYGGTWSRKSKASAITQAAKNAFNATSDGVSDIVSTVSQGSESSTASARSSSMRLPSTLSGSNRASPLAATTTKINITSNGSSSPSLHEKKHQDTSKESGTRTRDDNEDPGSSPSVTKFRGMEDLRRSSSSTSKAEVDANTSKPRLELPKAAQGTGASWFGWLSQPASVGDSDKQPAVKITSKRSPPESPNQAIRSPAQTSKDSEPRSETNRSWLGVWKASPQIEQGQKPPELVELGAHTEPTPLEGPDRAEQSTSSSRSKGWAFWSTEESDTAKIKSQRSQSTGELALAGSSSQSCPEKASLDSAKCFDQPAPVNALQKSPGVDLTSDAAGNRQANVTGHGQPSLSNTGRPTESETPSVLLKHSEDTKPGSKGRVASVSPPKNLLLPPLDSCYTFLPRYGLLQQISNWIPNSQASSTNNLGLLPNPPRPKTALAIGVHGYFPTPLIRSVFGQPTGTSIKFANCAASAIQRWCESHSCKCEIEKVALEGEGKISERVDLLWGLLLNWIEKVRKADFILVACHSQGVPVANMLLAKLLSFGAIGSARIGICAMAGINMGPFPELRSRWIGGTTAELFDFGDPESTVSKTYQNAVETNVRYGVKMTYIGSIDDQLVSMESSTFGPAQHPYIYRAVFIDGKLHTPNFLSHLVGFALKLRNVGVADHGLIRELSSPLAGSLYTGEGHSRIYDEDTVYDLAVRFTLETSNVANVPLRMAHVAGTAPNPYILPFSMRGVLEEEHVKNELHEETLQLLRQFDDWKPSTKVLKDVKFRLEGVRSKI